MCELEIYRYNNLLIILYVGRLNMCEIYQI